MKVLANFLWEGPRWAVRGLVALAVALAPWYVGACIVAGLAVRLAIMPTTPVVPRSKREPAPDAAPDSPAPGRNGQKRRHALAVGPGEE